MTQFNNRSFYSGTCIRDQFHKIEKVVILIYHIYVRMLIEKGLDMTILQCILESTKPTKGQNRHYKTMKTKPCNQHADAMKTIYFIAVLKGLHFTV